MSPQVQLKSLSVGFTATSATATLDGAPVLDLYVNLCVILCVILCVNLCVTLCVTLCVALCVTLCVSLLCSATSLLHHGFHWVQSYWFHVCHVSG